jgi:D-glycerate 3-kinase
VATLSIDDLYLTRTQRQQLADTVHPLLQTRGVPATHDVALGVHILHQLQHASANTPIHIPIFDKARDDRLTQTRCQHGKVDIVLFEGWCVGTPPQPKQYLLTPINQLEAEDDPLGIWRKYVNQQLVEVYPALFASIQHLIVLQAPSFECVYGWRRLQEQKLAAKHVNDKTSGVMNDAQLQRFIMYYERLSRFNLEVLPAQAWAVLALNVEHRIIGCSALF